MNKVNKTDEGRHQDDCPEKNLEQMELDLHIAEYNALTTRCTYFTNIQNVVLSVLVIWTTVMIGLWIQKPTYIICWGTILGAQAFGIISSVLLYEEYNIIRYLESVLKPIIDSLIQKEKFWGYQSFLITQRKKSYKIWEFSTVILTGLIIAAIAITRAPWEWGDLLGFILNLFALYVYGTKTYSSAKIRWNSWKI